MKATSLVSAIKKRGGTAEVITREDGKQGVVGELNGHDVSMIPGANGTFYTVRKISQRGEYDPTSDYNPGGYTYCRQINSLDWATK